MIVPILMYHSISTSASSKFLPWTITPTRFAEQLAFLREQGYTALTVSDFAGLLAGGQATAPERPVVITFDDGFADFAECAVPLLAANQMRATIYIVTSTVGGTSRWLAAEGEGQRPMLSWDEIAALPASVVEIGAHSHTHPQLDTLSLTAADREIRTSKAILEDHLGREISSFAYPHGYHGPQVRRMVQDAGFSSACAVKHAMSSLQDDRFALSRIIVYRDQTIERFTSLLSGETLRVAPQGERIQTVLWRVVRRTLLRARGAERERIPG
jgi:peptidoglycan/xylan/chitin deacetylase (PgdA/CDA1 family)